MSGDSEEDGPVLRHKTEKGWSSLRLMAPSRFLCRRSEWVLVDAAEPSMRGRKRCLLSAFCLLFGTPSLLVIERHNYEDRFEISGSRTAHKVQL